MTQRICTLDDCEAPHHSKGMCKPHYRRDHYRRNREAALAYAKTYWAENHEEITAKTRARFQENPEARRATVRKYKAANPDKAKADAERFRRAHPERQAAWAAAWYAANRDYARGLQDAWRAEMMKDPAWAQKERIRGRAKQSRRRAQMRETQIEQIDLATIVDEHGMVCHICRADILDLSDLHFDHVVPLAKGGPHTAENIRPAHAFCNLSKGAKLLARIRDYEPRPTSRGFRMSGGEPLSWTTNLLTAIVEQLHAESVGVWKPGGGYLSSDIAIVFGRLPSTPDRAIAVAAYGVDQFADDPVNTDSTQGVQLRLRGIPHDPRSVDEIADQAFDALQGWRSPSAGILLCTRRINAPMGVDGNQRFERADSYHLLMHRPSTYRPG